MTYVVTVSHVDTCLPGFVTDHHNRPGELLIGVDVDGTTTRSEVKEGLNDELDSADYGLPDDPSFWTTLEAAVEEALPSAGVDVFDPSLEPRGDGDAESCAAWFLIEWDERDECDG